MYNKIVVLMFQALILQIVLWVSSMVMPVEPEYKTTFNVLLCLVLAVGGLMYEFSRLIREKLESKEDN